MRDLVTSLVSSVIAGTAVWFGQWLLRYHRLARKRAFFGITPGADCVLIAPRHFSSPQASSVHRTDMTALVELATIVDHCGGRAEVSAAGDGTVPSGLGRHPEFCVGGPSVNQRTAAHLRAFLPGVRYEADEPTLVVDGTRYRGDPAHAEYVLLAKAPVPGTRHPVFVIAGQTARTNLAAARLLATGHRRLLRRYGVAGRFCLVLKLVEPDNYGPDFVELVADVTETAFGPREPVPQP
ncbi:MAG TPA: hypothetical protein VIL37_18560 [Natronosporangium sp.]